MRLAPSGRSAEERASNAQAEVDALTKSRKQAEINKENSTAQISAADNEATAKFTALQTIDSLLDGVNSTCSSSSRARVQAQQQFDTAEENVQTLEANHNAFFV